MSHGDKPSQSAYSSTARVKSVPKRVVVEVMQMWRQQVPCLRTDAGRVVCAGVQQEDRAVRSSVDRLDHAVIVEALQPCHHDATISMDQDAPAPAAHKGRSVCTRTTERPGCGGTEAPCAP